MAAVCPGVPDCKEPLCASAEGMAEGSWWQRQV